MTVKPAPACNGFTLIEVMIALGLFALISVAGLGLVEAVLGVQERTRERLDRIAAIRRANYVMELDLDQIEPGGFSGTASSLAFRRHGLGGPVGVDVVQYDVSAKVLERQVGQNAPQNLLSGVEALSVRYYRNGRWNETPGPAARLPEGVAITITLTGSANAPWGRIRHVAVLPKPI